MVGYNYYSEVFDPSFDEKCYSFLPIAMCLAVPSVGKV